MPYTPVQARPRHGRPDLVQLIVDELRRVPGDAGPQGAPDVREEQQRFSDRLHVYVVWDRWAEVPDEHRGEIILDAYEKQFGAAKAANVAVAMGVTRAEAQRMGILR